MNLVQLNIPHCHRCKHRQRPCWGACACADGVDVRDHARAGYCPRGIFGSGSARKPFGWEKVPKAGKTGERPAAASIEERGPALWKLLHGHAAAYAGDEGAARAWLRAFAAQIPCGDCARHWKALTEATPPDLSGRAAFFEWTVHAHNAVNARLGKPTLPLWEARKLHGVPPGE